MCLILFSHHHHPSYKLVLIANRDEFYERPTKMASWWDDHPHILGGRDLTHHGSWLAITKQGKIAAITNYRDPNNIKSNAPSRGHLLNEFLTTSLSIAAFSNKLLATGNRYNGFNLLYGNQDELAYFSNYGSSPKILTPGNYGLSNSLLNTPWPKVVKGKEKLDKLLFSSDKFSVQKALKALKDNRQANENELPDTGIGLEKEKILSPMFIESPGYGSRCSTIITIDQNNRVDFNEFSYFPEGKFQHTFTIED